jgi:hypothetical protein
MKVNLSFKGANASIYGVAGGAGVIIVNTRRGDSPDSDAPKTTTMSPGLLSISPAGFYKAREFYAPRYNVSTAAATSRGIVYWNPNVVTDKDGNAMFNFTGANAPGTYNVIVEGIDGAGNIGRQVIKYTVQ